MTDYSSLHIAIIPDGNRRWAKNKGLPTILGHKKGFENTESIIVYAHKLGVKALTFYAFSTENWSRSKDEVDYLMKMFNKFLDKYLKKFKELGIRLKHIGNFSNLSEENIAGINKAILETKDNTGMTVQLALNYGGRDEILRAINKLIAEKKTSITEDDLNMTLDTGGVDDPDLLIRTSGEMRISNFMPWQMVYTELHFTEKYWPDFTKKDFKNALDDFALRQRRFGA